MPFGVPWSNSPPGYFSTRPAVVSGLSKVLASQSQCRCWVMSRLFGKGCSMSAATKTGHSDAIDASTTA
jgi:hypothetical protein